MESKEKSLRYNKGKLKWSYVNFEALEPMVEVLMFGAEKYAPKNWQKGLDLEEILESMMRHLTALIDGEEVDPESGISHMGHIQCNSMFFNYHLKKYRDHEKREKTSSVNYVGEPLEYIKEKEESSINKIGYR